MDALTIGTESDGERAWLDRPAAESYLRMVRDGCPAGGITDAGRTRAEQEDLYARFLRGELTATAARPGTSKHESGRALDLAAGALEWARRHGREYGWVPDRVPNERWHLEYVEALDEHKGEAIDMLTKDDKVWIDKRLAAHLDARVGLVDVASGKVRPDTALGYLDKMARQNRAALAAQRELLEQLAKAQGATIDYARIDRIVRKALEAGVDVDITVKGAGS